MDIKTSGYTEHELHRETRADLNFSNLIKLVTPRNIAKATITIGSVTASSYLGAIVGAGIGFMCFGPAGCVAGYNVGNFLGATSGILSGVKLGTAIAEVFGESADICLLGEASTSVSSKHDSKVRIEK